MMNGSVLMDFETDFSANYLCHGLHFEIKMCRVSASKLYMCFYQKQSGVLKISSNYLLCALVMPRMNGVTKRNFHNFTHTWF
jgi:hypothetical protein